MNRNERIMWTPNIGIWGRAMTSVDLSMSINISTEFWTPPTTPRSCSNTFSCIVWVTTRSAIHRPYKHINALINIHICHYCPPGLASFCQTGLNRLGRNRFSPVFTKHGTTTAYVNCLDICTAIFVVHHDIWFELCMHCLCKTLTK